ncbi:hypothetical protein Hanom_Chr05g00416641 [Helianthus anomalus]
MALWFLDKIPLMANDTTHEAVIIFKNDEENFHMLDQMWIVNMSAVITRDLKVLSLRVTCFTTLFSQFVLGCNMCTSYG